MRRLDSVYIVRYFRPLCDPVTLSVYCVSVRSGGNFRKQLTAEVIYM